MSDVPQGHFSGVSGHPCPHKDTWPFLGEPVGQNLSAYISSWASKPDWEHTVLLWRLRYVLLYCKILAEEISCVGGKPKGHRTVSVIQSQILPWVCILLHPYCLQSPALCFPKMSCFLLYFNRGLVSNPLLSYACREFPAEASSRCVETFESRTCPWAPLAHHCSGDGPRLWAPQSIPQDSSCQFYSLVFIKVHWGERVREKREKSERSLQSQRAMSTNCLKHHSLTFFPQLWKIPWGRLPYCTDLFIKRKFYCAYPLLQVPGMSIKESKNLKKV